MYLSMRNFPRSTKFVRKNNTRKFGTKETRPENSKRKSTVAYKVNQKWNDLQK